MPAQWIKYIDGTKSTACINETSDGYYVIDGNGVQNDYHYSSRESARHWLQKHGYKIDAPETLYAYTLLDTKTLKYKILETPHRANTPEFVSQVNDLNLFTGCNFDSYRRTQQNAGSHFSYVFKPIKF